MPRLLRSWLARAHLRPAKLLDADGEPVGRRRLGELGEQLAASYLQARGCKILIRNFSAPRGGEADLVIRDKDSLVFVEVKTRRSGALYRPASNVDRNKRRLLRRASHAYVGMLADASKIPLRFDIVELILGHRQIPEIRWIRHAFGLDEQES